MTALDRALEQALSKHLGSQGVDLIDVLPVPRHADKLVRIKTLEEIIEDFELNDRKGGGTHVYLIHVRRKDPHLDEKKNPDTSSPAISRPKLEGVFLPSGKLNVTFLMRNAEILFHGGEFALARNIYKTLLKSGECTAQALFWIGKTLEAEGKPLEAISYFEDSLLYHPTLEIYHRLSALLIDLKKNQEAAELLEKALKLKELQKDKESRYEVHKTIGHAWLLAKSPEKAEGHFKQALQAKPLADAILATLGSLYLQKGKIADAKRCYAESLSSNPKNAEASLGIGTCLYNEGNKGAAHDHFVQSLESHLNNATAIYYLVRCAYEIKSYSHAEKWVQAYTQVAPVNLSLLYSLAGLQFHLGKLRECRATSQKILELSPEHAGTADLLKLTERYLSPH